LVALNRWIGDTPLAITNHGLYSHTVPEWVFDWYLRTLGKWTFNQADVVFCYTDDERAALRDRGVGVRIEVVPNGIDTARFTPDGSESERITGNGPTALFVGRLVEGKRPAEAVTALADARADDRALQLAICGEGPLRADLEALAADLGVASSVQFLGQVPYEEMPAVYRSADILVLPSRTEGVPRTVLEAISSGVPVVCSRLDQLEEIVSRDGRGELVDVATDGALARAVVRLLDGDVRPEPLGSDYAWQTTVDETTDVLASLAGT
jgi:glycosyltransferase involved in cell wall biosynthesis